MSHEIIHQVGIKASPEEIYKALTENIRIADYLSGIEMACG